LSEENEQIVALDWGWGRDQESTSILEKARAALERYFDGAAETFDLPLTPFGTNYQRKVWQALREIPYGETRTYAELAVSVGGSARSIGGAVGANPIPILIPCHRILGSRGLGGYSGGCGLEDKIALLKIEGVKISAR